MNRLYAGMIKGISLIIKVLAICGALFAIVKLFVEEKNRSMWFTFLLFNILLYAAAGLLGMLLRKKFPQLDKYLRKKNRSGLE